MKKVFLFLFSLCAINIPAQDIIVKKDGTTIQSKVLKITTSEIEYKKFSHQNGPTYSIMKADVQAINYESGEKDIFDGDSNLNHHIATGDKSNVTLISKFNQDHYSNDKLTSTKAKYIIAILGIDDSSVISTDDIEICFLPTYGYHYQTGHSWLVGNMSVFQITIKNKSNHILYFDLGNAFRIYSNGRYDVYYTPDQTTVSSGNGTGIGLNLGGVANILGVGGALGMLAGGMNIGSSSSASISKTYATDRILAIPPFSEKALSYDRTVSTRKNIEIINKAEPFFDINKTLIRPLCVGEMQTFSSSNSPFIQKYLLTYSKDPNFNVFYTMNFSLFMREAIGVRKSNGDFTDGGAIVDGSNEDIKETCINYGNNHIGNFDSSMTIFNVFKNQ